MTATSFPERTARFPWLRLPRPSALLKLLREAATPEEGKRILWLAGISGLANAALLVVINLGAQDVGKGESLLPNVGMFLVAGATYVYTLKLCFETTVRLIETTIERLRLRIVEKIERTELPVLEEVGTARIYNALTRESAVLTNTTGLVTAALQGAAMIVFGSLYLVYLSPIGFVVIATLAALGVRWFFKRDRFAKSIFKSTSARELEFFKTLDHALSGFKETRLRWRRSRDLQKDLREISGDVRDLRINAQDLANQNFIYGQSFFYALLAATVFIYPVFAEDETATVLPLMTAVLFLMAPLIRFFTAIPELNKANVAAEVILAIEKTLDDAAATTEPIADPVHEPETFHTIELQRAMIRYRADSEEVPFQLGPIDLTLNKGEILFLVGGNGSGKSTLIRMLTGMEFPQEGVILLDGEPVTAPGRQEYRELFSAVFADFHLFDKMYGLLDADEGRLAELLRLMQLDKQTRVADHRFSRIDLSTGQRKRLALLLALLDDRPIFVFDELAADQDPEFRKYLYTTLLPELKERGKTIVAATHDDRYFSVADRILRLDYGHATELTP